MSTPLKKVADPEELQRHTYALKALFAKECSDENDSVSCHRLAEFFQSVEKDFPAAVAQYKENCEVRRFGLSCLSAGVQYFVGSHGVEKNMPLGLELFDKGCELGNGESCNNAGMAWRRGKGVEQPDFKKAEAYFKKGCDEGNEMRSCYNLSTLYLMGGDADLQDQVPRERRLARDMGQAFLYASKACELGHTYGCINAAKQLETGDGVPADPEGAAELKEKARKLHTKRK